MVASSARLGMSLFIFWRYYKHKKELALYFALFFLLVSLHGLFRAVSILNGDVLWLFVSRLMLTLGATTLLQALVHLRVAWIERFHTIEIFMVVAVMLSYLDAYVFGGLTGEQTHLLSGIPLSAMLGLTVLLTAYYFHRLGKGLPRLGYWMLVLGLTFEGILLMAAVFFARTSLEWIGFLLAVVFTAMIGAGWWLSYPKTASEKE